MASLSESDVYLARFGWHVASSSLAACGLAVVVFACLGGLVLWLALLIGAVGAVVFVVFAGAARGRGVALRVGPEGVTLGGGPLPFGRVHPTHVPWPEVEAVLLWGPAAPAGAGPRYVGVRVRAAAEAPAWPPRAAAPAARVPSRVAAAPPARADLPAGPPRDGAVLGRAIQGWRLDRARLLAAVAAFAPEGVRVVDAS
ncbi:hypothetical protein [Streptomyces marincola]|uniref:hypothetical protein n=1 Tax=Streptomyces marincola TaxID=2878388 RepID=UPI001CF15F27|nr:hypothetical protein [Streptomyces marincola]UCM91176.1 hypothetical protein LC193_26330 [Streptomyces marincola]